MLRTVFIARMNAEAALLGMSDSHFVNPIGLDDAGLYTSAADLAKAAIALRSRFPEVAAMAAVPAITLPASATHHALKLYNLNELIRTYRGATGLKTGWTGRAGGCLIATATRDGRHLLVVVMGSPRVFDEAGAVIAHRLPSSPGVLPAPPRVTSPRPPPPFARRRVCVDGRLRT